MNTAFHDALNFAWKIHLVEAGFASRSILASYEEERKLIAENLLDFDAKFAALFSARMPSASEVGSANSSNNTESPNEFVEVFKSACEFTSGYGIMYRKNLFNWSRSHPAKSPLFNPKGVKLISGKAFTPSTVTRLSDANIVHLEQEIPVNGSFRIYIFAGNQRKTHRAVSDFAANLARKRSFYSAYQRPVLGKAANFERHNPHSPFFTLCVIYASEKNKIDISAIPRVLRSYYHHLYADDIPDIRVPTAQAASHAKIGFSLEQGGVVVSRPDGHVACTLKLVEGSGTVDALNEYFSSFVTKPLGQDFHQAQL